MGVCNKIFEFYFNQHRYYRADEWFVGAKITDEQYLLMKYSNETRRYYLKKSIMMSYYA